MVGTHRERIERLEARYDVIEERMAKLTTTERKLDRVLRNRPRHSSPSSSETSRSSDASSEDLHLTWEEHGEDPPRRGDDRWRGRPKLTCPTFDGTEPISWLSRVSQFFNLNEIDKSERVKYAAFYLEGEANVW